jgi:hypothetical protein
MIEYKELTMQIDNGSEIVLYDGKEFQNFEKLQKVCGCKQIEWMGKTCYDDNQVYTNINDDVMDGITENNPAGRWNDDGSFWSWGIFINDAYVTFRYYI